MCGFLLATWVSVTNLAGCVVSGELTSVTNGTFTFSGRTYPLTILPTAEQHRLAFTLAPERSGLPNRPLSPSERRLRSAIQRDLDRARVRYEAGEMTEEAWRKKQSEAAAAMNFTSANR